MKYLIVAMLLAVVLALPPVPRKAADNSASTGSDIQSQPKPNQAPAAQSPPTVEPNGTTFQNSNGDKQGKDDADHSITISKLPTVTVATPKKDWADWGYWIFSLFLVVVGVLQVGLLWRTLGAIQRQADLMERQTVKLDESVAVADRAAIAAKTSADALIASERARVVVELRQCAFRNGTIWFREDGAWLDVADVLAGKHLIYKLAITNLGRTPAEMFSYEIKWGLLIEGSPFNPNLLTSQSLVNLNDFLSGGETRILHRINTWDAFNPVLAGKQKGAICVTIRYGDVVTVGSAESRKEHATELLYYYDPWADFPLQQVTAQTKYT